MANKKPEQNSNLAFLVSRYKPSLTSRLWSSMLHCVYTGCDLVCHAHALSVGFYTSALFLDAQSSQSTQIWKLVSLLVPEDKWNEEMHGDSPLAVKSESVGQCCSGNEWSECVNGGICVKRIERAVSLQHFI